MMTSVFVSVFTGLYVADIVKKQLSTLVL